MRLQTNGARATSGSLSLPPAPCSGLTWKGEHGGLSDPEATDKPAGQPLHFPPRSNRGLPNLVSFSWSPPSENKLSGSSNCLVFCFSWLGLKVWENAWEQKELSPVHRSSVSWATKLPISLDSGSCLLPQVPNLPVLESCYRTGTP